MEVVPRMVEVSLSFQNSRIFACGAGKSRKSGFQNSENFRRPRPYIQVFEH